MSVHYVPAAQEKRHFREAEGHHVSWKTFNTRVSKLKFSIVGTMQMAVFATVLVVIASTAAQAAKTQKELEKDGYDCAKIPGAIECRKGKDDPKYLCDINGTGCQSYKVGNKAKSNADKVIGTKPLSNSTIAN
jgi:hypothetical protein